VRLVSERSIREVSLEDDSSELSTVNSQSFVDEQEWRLYSSVDTRLETVIRIYQGDDCIRPSFTTMCYAARRFGYYAWNIIFVMVKILVQLARSEVSYTHYIRRVTNFTYLLTYLLLIYCVVGYRSGRTSHSRRRIAAYGALR
jgi:hypothetical protein